MDDPRSEIRDAFEREQAAHPPAVGLRPATVRAASTRPRPEQPNLQWLAMVATIVIGVLIVVALMSSRLTNRGAISRTPASSAATTSPAGDYGPPPAGVNLIYVHDPGHRTWLIGYDWSGKPRATVKLDPTQTAVTMAPDGQTFALGLYAKGGNWQFLDSFGKPIGGPTALPGVINPRWADDNRHVCGITLDQQTFAWTLWTQLPGEAAKRVTEIARDSGIGQSFVGLVACSFKNDTAVAVRTLNVPTEYWVIQLSTGKLLKHRDNLPPMASIVVSDDSSLVAENSTRSTGMVDAPASSTRSATTIRFLTKDTVVTTIDGSMGVLAFSGDKSLALVTLAPWVGGQPAHLGVVDLSTGAVIWQDDGTTVFDWFVVQPGGRSFALSYSASGQPGPGPATVLIVSGDGTAIKLGVYSPTWW